MKLPTVETETDHSGKESAKKCQKGLALFLQYNIDPDLNVFMMSERESLECEAPASLLILNSENILK